MFLPIERYGIVGNMHSAALIGDNGSIDWLCLPDFDSPSVFGAILDDEIGGSFQIRPKNLEDCSSSQMYWPDTNVLLTRFCNRKWSAEIADFMPVKNQQKFRRLPDLVRMVSAEDGPVEISVIVRPAFDYARAEHKIEQLSDQLYLMQSASQRLLLACSTPLVIDNGRLSSAVALERREKLVIYLKNLEDSEDPRQAISIPLEAASDLMDENVAFWQKWVSQCSYHGRYEQQVKRSALALKLLTYEKTGAIIAAPTCSLPEGIGGSRNWDYRYTWLRDAAYTVYAFLRVGFTQEAAAFIEWINERCLEVKQGGTLQPLYTIRGESEIPEFELSHLKGYRNSQPVRVGNAASKQFQLDVSGALLDAIYLYNKHAQPVSYNVWQHVQLIVSWVCERWREPDQGIWEVRSDPKHFVFSKLMCWVALDRAIRLAEKRSFPAPREEWIAVRDEIFEELMNQGWNEQVQAFTQSYDSSELDAANLLMPLVFFIAPSDERMLSTIAATRKSVNEGGLAEDFFLMRYNTESFDDGVGGDEGAFTICTLWLVEAMTRAGMSDASLLNEAELLFHRVLHCASPLGLFAEQTDRSHSSLGNYPQGFSHLAVISCAFNLERARAKLRGKVEIPS